MKRKAFVGYIGAAAAAVSIPGAVAAQVHRGKPEAKRVGIVVQHTRSAQIHIQRLDGTAAGTLEIAMTKNQALLMVGEVIVIGENGDVYRVADVA